MVEWTATSIETTKAAVWRNAVEAKTVSFQKTVVSLGFGLPVALALAFLALAMVAAMMAFSSAMASAVVSAMAAGAVEETVESKVTSTEEAAEEEAEVEEMVVERARAEAGVLVGVAAVAAEVAPRVLSSFGGKVFCFFGGVFCARVFYAYRRRHAFVESGSFVYRFPCSNVGDHVRRRALQDALHGRGHWLHVNRLW